MEKQEVAVRHRNLTPLCATGLRTRPKKYPSPPVSFAGSTPTFEALEMCWQGLVQSQRSRTLGTSCEVLLERRLCSTLSMSVPGRIARTRRSLVSAALCIEGRDTNADDRELQDLLTRLSLPQTSLRLLARQRLCTGIGRVFRQTRDCQQGHLAGGCPFRERVATAPVRYEEVSGHFSRLQAYGMGCSCACPWSATPAIRHKLPSRRFQSLRCVN